MLVKQGLNHSNATRRKQIKQSSFVTCTSFQKEISFNIIVYVDYKNYNQQIPLIISLFYKFILSCFYFGVVFVKCIKANI